MQRVLSDELFGKIQMFTSCIHHSYNWRIGTRLVLQKGVRDNCPACLGVEWDDNRAHSLIAAIVQVFA